MAINKNHEFEELNGVKCAIVEKNASTERTQFLKDLLEFNNYTVVVVPSAPAKPAAAVKPVPPKTPPQNEAAVPETPAAQAPVEATPPPPETFTVGVTDVTFNPTNAVFGRLLKTPDGHVVTLAYWQQKEAVAHDEIPYFEKK
ncbi:MAG: hypothetical protein ICV84_06220 [Flavisolibacter sp.]|nr:hypothetical protein [Flavisolibacter sp.]